MKGQSTLFSSSSDEWETPQDLFDSLNKIHKFTLDPCATKQNRKCKKYYSKRDNGLIHSWAGERVFCNPPYSQIKDWVKKCHDEDQAQTVLLVPARTDTKWFHAYIAENYIGRDGWKTEYWHDVLFLQGRLKFGGSTNSAPFPSMLVFFHV